MSYRSDRAASGAGAVESQDRRVVLPAKLPEHTQKFLKKALAAKPLAQNFTWVFKRYEAGSDFVGLVDQFLERYENQLTELAGAKIDGAKPLLRAGLSYRMLDALKPHRLRMADVAVNPLFVEVFLKKRLLAEVMGITITDIQRRIVMSGRRPMDFLNDELREVLPETFLQHV